MMQFFDCCCSYGLSGHPPMRFARTPEELLQEMDWCGIDRALLYHTGMRFDSPVVWNEQVMTDLYGQTRLLGMQAILPPQTGELPAPATLPASMRAQGIAALVAFPDEHHYHLDQRTFHDLFAVLIEHHIPLFVKLNIVDIGHLMAECPELIVVAMNVGPHSLERYLRPLLDDFPTLHIETSHYLVECLIEEFVARYGPERLLFGSGFPDVSAGASLLRLAQADIAEEARVAIAGGNLERLLAEVRL